MSGLDDACRAARLEAVPWEERQAKPAWQSIELGTKRRIRRRRGLQVGALVGVGLAVVLGGRALPSTSDSASPAAQVASVHEPVVPPALPSVVAEPSREEREATPDVPDSEDSTLRGQTIVEHHGRRRVYDADATWTGGVRIAEGIEVRGEEASFEIETLPGAHRVTSRSSVVVIERAGQRVLLQPGESMRFEVQTSVIGKKKRRPATHPTPAKELLAAADAARVQGDLRSAAATLRTFISAYPNHEEVGTVWFQLGKVERRRGRHQAAAKAFGRSRPYLEGGGLESDALAAEARSLSSAKRTREAKRLAQEYLRMHASGVHAAAMREIVEAP